MVNSFWLDTSHRTNKHENYLASLRLHIINTRQHFVCNNQTSEAAHYQGMEHEHRNRTTTTATCRT